MSNALPLSLRSLSKRFGPRTVINNLNLDIKAGEFVALIGRSGCGKSTLLRLLAQLEPLTSGQILSGTVDAERRRSQTRLMFQEARLLPWQSVLDNVGLGLSGHWQPLALKALDDVGLTGRANDWPAALSGGQRQRVALARALIHQPQLLLLDEPLGALDALTRLEMQRLIVQLWQQYGFTVILVTHDINEAVLTANRVLLIEDGGIDLSVSIDVPHPRTELVELAALEQTLLSHLLNLPAKPKVDYVI